MESTGKWEMRNEKNLKQNRQKPVRKRKSKIPCVNIVALNLGRLNLSRSEHSVELKRDVPNLERRGKSMKKPAVDSLDPSQRKVKNVLGAEPSAGKNSERSGPSKTKKARKKKSTSFGQKFTQEFVCFATEEYSKNNKKIAMSFKNATRWLKLAEVIDNKRITLNDVETHFIDKVKKSPELGIYEFIHFLKTLCEERGFEMPRLVEKLLNCRKDAPHNKGVGKVYVMAANCGEISVRERWKIPGRGGSFPKLETKIRSLKVRRKSLKKRKTRRQMKKEMEEPETLLQITSP